MSLSLMERRSSMQSLDEVYILSQHTPATCNHHIGLCFATFSGAMSVDFLITSMIAFGFVL
jgi:hypothetical protein